MGGAGKAGGRLRIGDSWNAISIIALSQNNPLKAIAEFVENSIDARAQNVTIVRGKDRGELYLKVIDDGEGIPLDPEGQPDFRYVATHVCDSFKRKLKKEGAQGIQGEFGIGLLSFWTVGERLILSSAGADGKAYQMEMRKSEPGYVIAQKRTLFSHSGVELTIRPLLPGLRQLNGEKIQSYLASELRDRIRKSGVRITIKDRYSRKELEVQPRKFTGRLLHELGPLGTPLGDVDLELYLNDPAAENRVSLYRAGTRVLPSLSALDFFDRPPWNSGYFQGMIDAPFLQLTPGTRDGIIRDESFDTLCRALERVEAQLAEIVEAERRAEEEEASRNILRSVQRALREAFLALPPEEYDWFSLYAVGRRVARRPAETGMFEDQPEHDQADRKAVDASLVTDSAPGAGQAAPADAETAEREDREFYEFPGPLYSAVISPASAILRVGAERSFRCIPRDHRRRTVEERLSFQWRVLDGLGSIDDPSKEIINFTAPEEPGLTILEVRVVQAQGEGQAELACTAEAIVTVTDSLLPREGGDGPQGGKGLPGYTFLRAPGELWRSKYDPRNNLVVINNGHRDYLFAAKTKARKLRYICRLFAKELVLENFPGFEPGELLERMIELGLYTEENLK
ncbi:MAG: ATP-binding protein [Spirochaetales bacterium]|nr:ATP-binding protein [Spirochaetales bacterium]